MTGQKTIRGRPRLDHVLAGADAKDTAASRKQALSVVRRIEALDRRISLPTRSMASHLGIAGDQLGNARSHTRQTARGLSRWRRQARLRLWRARAGRVVRTFLGWRGIAIIVLAVAAAVVLGGDFLDGGQWLAFPDGVGP